MRVAKQSEQNAPVAMLLLIEIGLRPNVFGANPYTELVMMRCVTVNEFQSVFTTVREPLP